MILVTVPEHWLSVAISSFVMRRIAQNGLSASSPDHFHDEVEIPATASTAGVAGAAAAVAGFGVALACVEDAATSATAEVAINCGSLTYGYKENVNFKSSTSSARTFRPPTFETTLAASPLNFHAFWSLAALRSTSTLALPG